MSSFTAGFAARLDAAAQALHLAYSQAAPGFTPADLKASAGTRRADRSAMTESSERPDGTRRPVSFTPQPINPRHFSPADPGDGGDPPEAREEPASLRPETAFVDPIAAARAAGFAEGFAAAQDSQHADQDRNDALLKGLTEALHSASHIDRDRLATHLRQTILLLITKMIGETEIDGPLLASRITAATDMLADKAEAAVLRVHPDDIALLDGLLPTTLHAQADAEVARGSFVLESASTIVEDGPELWLEQLAQAIDRVAVPPIC